MSRYFVLFLIAIFSMSVSSCVIFPEGLNVSPKMAYDDAKAIYLVKSVRSKTDGINHSFNFNVLQVFKGPNRKQIELFVDASLWGNIQYFEKHEAVKFWLKPYSAGMFVNSDCKLRPNFNVGYEYLVLLGEKDNIRSYEIINSPDDYWLNYIKSLSQGHARAAYSYSSFKSQIQSLSTYRCPRKGDRKASYLKTYIGKPEPVVWPNQSGFRCAGTGFDYAQLKFEGSDMVYFVPIDGESLDFNFLAGDTLVLPKNKLPLSEL